MLEKTFEGYLDCKETKPISPKEINSEYSFTGRTDAEAEPSILWPHVAKNRLIGKDPDAGKN